MVKLDCEGLERISYILAISDMGKILICDMVILARIRF